mmetsp:Transcript_100440/g.215238  ORF Transcript_100440/g.215238 Transcript_100440/m.215238 type:complete len:626 (-) Transcript_100440:568-2445(-)
MADIPTPASPRSPTSPRDEAGFEAQVSGESTSPARRRSSGASEAALEPASPSSPGGRDSTAGLDSAAADKFRQTARATFIAGNVTKKAFETFSERCDKSFSETDRRLTQLEHAIRDIRVIGENQKVQRLQAEFGQLRVDQEKTLSEFAEKLEKFDDDVYQFKNRFRDERHRVASAATFSERNAKTLEKVSGNLSSVKVGFQADIERVAWAVKALATEVQSLQDGEYTPIARSPHRSGFSHGTSVKDAEGIVASTSRARAGEDGEQATASSSRRKSGSTRHRRPSTADSETGDEVSEMVKSQDHQRLQEVMQKLDASVAFQKQLAHEQLDLQKMVKRIPTAEEDITSIKANFSLLEKKETQFEQFVQEQLFSVKKKQAQDMLDSWSKKWDPAKKTQLLGNVLNGWMDFVAQRRRVRTALARTKRLYAKTHVTARLRAWWYHMQKDAHEMQLGRLEGRAKSQASQLELLQSTLARHEKAAAEHSRAFQHRILAVEKGLEGHESRKADTVVVRQMFSALELRLEQDYNLDPLKRASSNLQDAILRLEVGKLDKEVGDSDRARVEELTQDFQHFGGGQGHDGVQAISGLGGLELLLAIALLLHGFRVRGVRNGPGEGSTRKGHQRLLLR